jgi:hypothetical protein
LSPKTFGKAKEQQNKNYASFHGCDTKNNVSKTKNKHVPTLRARECVKNLFYVANTTRNASLPQAPSDCANASVTKASDDGNFFLCPFGPARQIRLGPFDLFESLLDDLFGFLLLGASASGLNDGWSRSTTCGQLRTSAARTGVQAKPLAAGVGDGSGNPNTAKTG